MIMSAAQHGRVIVGVDGSLVSLRALREAVAVARRRDARIVVAHVRAPEYPKAQTSLLGLTDLTPWPTQETTRSFDRAAEALIATCIEEGIGGTPPDIALSTVVAVGAPHTSLIHLVRRDDDLLVVGTGNRSRWSRLWRRSVSKHCIAHARCPVLVVPQDSFARAIRRERRWYRSLRRRDLWREFLTEDHESRQRVGDA